jgi:hypothetical protein
MRIALNLPSKLAEESQSPQIAEDAVVFEMITCRILFIGVTTGKMRLPYLPNALLSSAYLAKDTVRNK